MAKMEDNSVKNGQSETGCFISACCYLYAEKGLSNQTDPHHLCWNAGNYPEISSPRLRFVPDPVQLLFQVLQPLREHIKVPPERIGLFLDPGQSFCGLQKEFYMPVSQNGMNEASPLLFPYTTDSCATSLAAIQFDIKGPCIAIHSMDNSAIEMLASAYLTAGLIDTAIIAGLNYADPEWSADITKQIHHQYHVPFVDCAAAAVLSTPLQHSLPRVPDDFAAHYGFTGAAERLLAYALEHGDPVL